MNKKELKDLINKDEMKMQLLNELSKKPEFKKTLENFAKN
ncbi:hypothetical protein HEPPS_02810 [Candidatus Hepatoplasma crinochetorum]|uniref:Uncharacterized protein n=1 Tax=Candidatus Hepatoplasma crinochetorum TaxID=295596 RepID=A0A0G7ZN71_9MOLU|nr:hypothetical protein HEPPS_02810 [Candidatus Hepatoplasma crinochetorum]